MNGTKSSTISETLSVTSLHTGSTSTVIGAGNITTKSLPLPPDYKVDGMQVLSDFEVNITKGSDHRIVVTGYENLISHLQTSTLKNHDNI